MWVYVDHESSVHHWEYDSERYQYGTIAVDETEKTTEEAIIKLSLLDSKFSAWFHSLERDSILNEIKQLSSIREPNFEAILLEGRQSEIIPLLKEAEDRGKRRCYLRSLYWNDIPYRMMASGCYLAKDHTLYLCAEAFDLDRVRANVRIAASAFLKLGWTPESIVTVIGFSFDRLGEKLFDYPLRWRDLVGSNDLIPIEREEQEQITPKTEWLEIRSPSSLLEVKLK